MILFLLWTLLGIDINIEKKIFVQHTKDTEFNKIDVVMSSPKLEIGGFSLKERKYSLSTEPRWIQGRVARKNIKRKKRERYLRCGIRTSSFF